MPRAPRICPKPSCGNKQPCAIHPQGWAANKGPGLPSNWKSVKRAVLGAPGGRVCRHCGGYATTVDHIIPRAAGGHGTDPSNLQPLCGPCHDIKSHKDKNWRHRR